MFIEGASTFLIETRIEWIKRKEGCEMKTHVKALSIALILTAMVVPLVLNAASVSVFGSEAPMQTNRLRLQEGQPFQEAKAGARLIKWLIAHSTPAEVNGKAIALVKHMLVVQVGETQVRVLMAPGWIVDEKVIRAGKLFNGTYMSFGDTITVKALKTVLKTDDTGFSLYTLLGYEIIDETSGAHAYAILPFNIETSG